MQSRQVFYWRGLCRRATLNDHDKLQLQKFVQGERGNLDFEPLKEGVFSIRGSNERRILFTFFTYQNKAGIEECAPLVLEILEHHEHDRSWCLQKGVANTFLNKNKEKITKAINNGDIGVITQDNDDPFTKDETANIELVEVDRYDGEFILLSEEQKEFKKQSLQQMPAMLFGPAGSGKTSTAFSLLLDFVEHYNTLGVPPEHPIAYISDNPNLIDELRQAWQANDNPAANTEAGRQVIFITGNEMLDRLRHNSPAAALNPISSKDIPALIRKHIVKQSKNNRQHPLLAMNDLQLVHEGGIAAVCSKANYLALGEFESGLNNGLKNQRDFYWGVIASLNQELEKQKQFIPGFYSFKRKICFSTSIYDEGQSSLLLKILQAMQSTEKNRTIVCLDPLQSNGKPNPDASVLTKILGTPKRPINIHELKVCFRTPEIITKFAEEMDHMRRFLNGGLDDKHSRSSFQGIGKPGSLRWLDEKQLAALPPDEFNNIDTAIVTHPHLVKKARKKLQTGLVFTAINIGGLQFKHIALYRYTESEAGMNVSKALVSYDPSKKAPTNLPKTPKGNTDYSLYCSEFHTGITRAMETLTLIESPCRKEKGDNARRHLLSHLKKTVDHLNANNAIPHERASETKTVADERDWEAAVASLVKSGHIEQAKMTWVTNLKRDEASFFEHFQLASNAKKPADCIELNDSDALLLSQNRIKDSFKWKDCLAKWTKPDAKNKTAPMLLRALLQPESIANLMKVMAEKSDYKNRVFQLFDAVNLKQEIIFLGVPTFLFALIITQMNPMLVNPYGRELLGRFFKKFNNPALFAEHLSDDFLTAKIEADSKTKKQSYLYLLLQIEESYPALEEYFIHHADDSPSDVAESFYLKQEDGERWSGLATLVCTEAGIRLLFRLMCERPVIMKRIPFDGWGKPGHIGNFSVFNTLLKSLGEAEKDQIKKEYPALYIESQRLSYNHLTESDSSMDEPAEEIDFSDDDHYIFDEEGDTEVIESYDDLSILTEDELVERLKNPDAGLFLSQEELGVSNFESFIPHETFGKRLLNFMKESSDEKIISMIQYIDFNKRIAGDEQPFLYTLLFSENGCSLLDILLSRVSTAMFTRLNPNLLFKTVFEPIKNPTTGNKTVSFMLKLSKQNPGTAAKMLQDNPSLIEAINPGFWFSIGAHEPGEKYSILSSFLFNFENPIIRSVFLTIIEYKDFEILKTTDLIEWLTRAFPLNGNMMSYLDLFDRHDETKELIDRLLDASTYDAWVKVCIHQPDLIAMINDNQTPLYLKVQEVKNQRIENPPKKLISSHGSATLFAPKSAPEKPKPPIKPKSKGKKAHKPKRR